MTGNEKRKALFLISMVSVIIMVLAISLPTLELKPGMPLPQVENNEVLVEPPADLPFVAISINRFLAIFFAFIASGAAVYVLYKLLKGASLKDILGYLGPMVAIVLFMSLVIAIILMIPGSESPVQTVPLMPTPEPAVRAPLGPVPPVLLWIVGLCLLVMGIFIAVWIYRSMTKESTIDLVAQEAEKARQDLLTGTGLRDVIIRCYTQMSLVLQEDRGLEREEFMTTVEFEKLLEKEGVPGEPIRELTRLFNMARYGSWQPNPEDEQKAIGCFDAIVRFSREVGEAC